MAADARITFKDYTAFEIIHGNCAHAFPLHFHRFDCLIKVDGGAVTIAADGRTTTLNKGESLFIAAFTPHALTPVDGASYTYTTLCFKKTHERGVKTGNDCIDKAADYIRARANKKLTLENLCWHCHISKFHLIRQFKTRFGLTPHQYHASTRIAQIRQGLTHNAALPDLAYALGFADQSHMCNVFKKYMGVTPLQYRQNSVLYSSADENVAKM